MTVARLRELGHDVKDLRGAPEAGMTDERVWTLAVKEDRLLITTDKGFTGRRYSHHSGILIVRLRQPNRLKIHRSVMHALERLGDRNWRGRLVVVRDTTMSVWRAPRASLG